MSDLVNHSEFACLDYSYFVFELAYIGGMHAIYLAAITGPEMLCAHLVFAY